LWRRDGLEVVGFLPGIAFIVVIAGNQDDNKNAEEHVYLLHKIWGIN